MANKNKRLPSYDTYVKQYLDKENKLAKLGYSMHDQGGMLTASEFYDMYYRLKSERQLEIKEGTRKSLSQITRDIVNQQAYHTSKKQAERIREAVSKLGGKVSVQKVMMGDPETTRLLREQYSLLKESGLSGSEAGLIMAQEYFGSP